MVDWVSGDIELRGGKGDYLQGAMGYRSGGGAKVSKDGRWVRLDGVRSRAKQGNAQVSRGQIQIA